MSSVPQPPKRGWKAEYEDALARGKPAEAAHYWLLGRYSHWTTWRPLETLRARMARTLREQGPDEVAWWGFERSGPVARAYAHVHWYFHHGAHLQLGAPPRLWLDPDKAEGRRMSTSEADGLLRERQARLEAYSAAGVAKRKADAAWNRSLVAAMYTQGLSTAEIMDASQLSRATVYRHLREARERGEIVPGDPVS